MNFKNKIAQIGITKIFLTFLIVFATITFVVASIDMSIFSNIDDINHLQNKIGEASLIDSSYVENGAFTINYNYTEYDISQNTIYYSIKENLGKDQNIDILNLYRDNILTKEISYSNIEILTDTEENIIGLVNISLGKLKIINQTCETSNETTNKTPNKISNEAIICSDNYYLGDGTKVDCDYVLADKTCYIESSGIIGTQMEKKYLPLPKISEKIVLDGLKIKNKIGGVTLPKDSIIQLRQTYNHPLLIPKNKPSSLISEYDIIVKSIDYLEDISVLDPSWWNTSWDYYKEYTNLTGNITYMDIEKTLNDNADFNDTRFISCYDESLVFNHTLEAIIGNIGQFRVNNKGENCSLRYYGNSEASSTSSASDVYFEPKMAYFFDKTTGNLIDYSNGNDLAETGTISSSSGYINGSRGTYSTSNYFSNVITDWAVGTDVVFGINVWVYGAINGNTQEIINFDSADTSKDMHNYLRIDGTGHPAVYSGYRATTTINYAHSTAVTDNTWTMISFLYKSNRKFDICINGGSCEESSNAHNSGSDSDSNRIIFGSIWAGGGSHAETYYFDEAYFYFNKDLTTDQIYSLYTQTAPNFIEGSESTSNTESTLIANATKPDAIYTNTDYLINITATDPEETYLNAWTQFYVDDSAVGNVQYYNLTNNTNSLIATLGNGNFIKGEVLIANIILGDGITNNSAINLSSSTVQNSIPATPTDLTINATIKVAEILHGVCSDSTDADTDTITYFYEFYNNNDTSIIQEYSSTQTYTIQSTDAHDIIRVRCKATTSDANSTEDEETISVSNSAPIITPTQTIVSRDANGTTYSYDYNVTDADLDTITWSDNTTLFNIASDTGIISDTPTESEAGSYSILITASDGIDSDTDIFSYIINDVTAPSISNLNWITTGGFTDDTLNYNQVLDYINITSTSTGLMNAYLTIIDPDDITILDEISMTNYTNDNYSYSSDITLNKAGIWTINVSVNDSNGNLNYSSDTILVSIQTQNLKDGWYGYSTEGIISSGDIVTLSNYGYDIFELEDNMTTTQTDFQTILDSINNSRESNIKVGLNIILDFDYNNSALQTQYLTDITENFSNLDIVPYSDAVRYISLELKDQEDFNDTIKYNLLNTFAENITSITNNAFVVFSKNYNNSNLDSSYISPTNLLYLTSSSETDFIEDQKILFKNNESLNRIYTNIPTNIKVLAQDFHSRIIDNLRSLPNPSSLTNENASSLNNKDVLIFNNGSSTKTYTIDVSALSVSGKDVWDSTEGKYIEENTNQVFNVEVNGYNATILYFEDLDHIQMDSNSEGTLYKGGSSSVKYSNHTDAILDGNFGMAGAYDVEIELYDKHYTMGNFMTYYGWLNVSSLHLTNLWSDYDVVILADENNDELDSLNYTATDFYAYISVADYNNTQGWTDAKMGEVNDWLALNDSLNIFVDGMDSGTGGTNFSSRMKNLIDYIQIDKARKGILNTYTAYEDFATWGNGGVMKESCINRWNGVSASTPDNYTRENWTLELERSEWFTAHNVDVYCQSFDNRTTDGTFTISNYTELQYIYFASKVLGYDFFYLSQPDFQYSHEEWVYDVGVDLDRSAHQLDSDSNTYYRTYENGIVYYNTTSGVGWIEDGLVVNSIQTCFYLYNPYANSPEWRFNINQRSPTGSIGEYSLTQDWSVGTWAWKCVDTTDEVPINGRYLIEAWVGDHTEIVGQGYNLGWSSYTDSGKHSWYDTSTTDSFTAYPNDQNWMVNMSVNVSKKISIDTTDKITQSEVNTSIIKNITISSSSSFPIEVWSNPTTFSNFGNVSFLNSTGSFIVLNYENNTDCDSSQPTWGETTIEGATYKACIEQSGDDTLVRVATPSLSDKVFQITSEVVSPIVSNFTFWALDTNQNIIGNETSFNTSQLEEIEYMLINFTVSDSSGIFGDIGLYYTANGSNGCSTGNKQTLNCHNYNNDTWIEFRNNTETSTFKDEGAIGDFISCDYIGSATERNYSCLIDEHYNPNIMKWYDAEYNFSDVKYQTGTSQRITKNNMIRVDLSAGVPLTADQYKLDLRVQITGTPKEPLEAYGCNSSYTTGNPEDFVGCALIAVKTASEITANGGKFRAIFTQELIDTLGDGKYIILENHDNAVSRYYALRTYKALNLSHDIMWDYSTNLGTSWTQNTDGYETEMNINWFYDNVDATEILFKIESNDTNGNIGNSTIYEMTWNIDTTNNYAPLFSFNNPAENETINGSSYVINFERNEPNNDNTYLNISLENITGSYPIITNLSSGIFNYTFDTTLFSDSSYNLTGYDCENETADALCGTDIHEIIIQNDNIAPNITFESDTTANGSSSQDYIFANVSASDENLDKIVINLYNSSGLYQTNISSSNFSINFTGLIDGTYYLNATANDTYSNENFTETRIIILDTVAPVMTINFPTLLNNPQITTFSINTNEVSTCNYTLDSEPNENLPSTDNLTHSLIKTLSDGSHSVTFYCKDGLGQVNESTRIFVVATKTPNDGGSSSSPTTTSTEIINVSSDFITLYSFNVTYDDFLKDSTNYINLKTYDNNNNLTDVDTVITTTDLEETFTKVTKLDKGEYRLRYDISETNFTELNVTILVKQNEKELTQNYIINLNEGNTFDKLGNNFESFFINVKSFFEDNLLLLTVLGFIIFLFGFLIIFYLSSVKIRN